VDMVAGCHDLHTWTITSDDDALSAHVTIQLERTDSDCEQEAHVPSLALGDPDG